MLEQIQIFFTRLPHVLTSLRDTQPPVYKPLACMPVLGWADQSFDVPGVLVMDPVTPSGHLAHEHPVAGKVIRALLWNS